MNDLRVVVRVIERVTKLARPPSDLIWLKNLLFLFRAQIRERFAVDVLHRDAGGVFVVHEVVNAHDGFVGEVEAAPSFPLEIV